MKHLPNENTNSLVGSLAASAIYDEAIIVCSAGYCVFDADQLLTAYSATFPSLYPAIEGFIGLGISYAEYLHLFLRHTAVANLKTAANADEWVDQQTSSFDEPRTFLHHLTDGRRIEIIQRPVKTGETVFVAFDVTRLHNQRAKVEREREKLLSFARLSCDWYWELDANLCYLYHSSHRSVIAGDSGDALLGQPRIETNSRLAVHDDCLQRHNAGLRQHRDVLETLQYYTAAGERIFVDLRAKPQFDAHGQFTGYIGFGQDVTERMRLTEKLEHNASIDYLTNLLNKRSFETRLEQALVLCRQRDNAGTLCQLDLDGFKTVNDSSGHAAGDECLRQVSAQLTTIFGDDATIGRLGGDEFGVVLPHTLQQAAELAREVVRSMASTPFIWQQNRYQVGASFGLVELTGEMNAAEILSMADATCYHAKRNSACGISLMNNGSPVTLVDTDSSASHGSTPHDRGGNDASPAHTTATPPAGSNDNADGPWRSSRSTPALSSIHSLPQSTDKSVGGADCTGTPLLAILPETPDERVVVARVGVVMDYVSTYQASIFTQLREYLSRLGIHCTALVCDQFTYTEADMMFPPDSANNGWPFDAYILLTVSIGRRCSVADMLQLIPRNSARPVVTIGDCAAQFPSIQIDNQAAIELLLDAICEHKSVQRIVFIRGFDGNGDSAARERAFRDELVRRGIPIDEALFLNGNFVEADTYKVVVELLQQRRDFQAIVAANDTMAATAVRAIQELGLRVPEDIAVTGFDDRRIAEACSPSLTTIRIPGRNFAHAGAELLLQQLELPSAGAPATLTPTTAVDDTGMNSIERTMLLQGQLVERESTRVQMHHSVDALAESPFNAAVQHLRTTLSDPRVTAWLPALLEPDFLTRALDDTLADGGDAFSNALLQIRATGDNEFEEHDHWHSIQQGLGRLLTALATDADKHAVRLALSRAHEKISSQVCANYNHAMFEQLREQQIHENLHIGLLSASNEEALYDALDTGLQDLGIVHAYITRQIREARNSEQHRLAFARVAGTRIDAEQLRQSGQNLALSELLRQLTHANLFVLPLRSAEQLHGYLLLEPASINPMRLMQLVDSIACGIDQCTRHQEQLARAEELRQINLELAQRTDYDAATGLPNRETLLTKINALQQLNDDAGGISIVHLRLMDFRTLSDSIGKANTDYLLRLLARRLSEATTADVTVARPGEAEFTAVLAATTAATERLADLLLDCVTQPVEVSGHTICLQATAGIASESVAASGPASPNNAERFIANADAAARHAGSLGSGRWVHFADHMASSMNKWRLDQDMRAGLRNGEFCLFYQPRVNATTLEIESLEALIRWFPRNSEGRETEQIGPYVFIPIAEESGFIKELGAFVLEAACQQVREWQQQGLHTRVSVNLSTVELNEDNLLVRVSDALQRHQLDSDAIELEITESAAMGDIEHSIEKLSALRNTGLEIAIDDFGSEYSSLNYLKRLPADYLKIDRSFVRDISAGDGPDDKGAAIVEAIISLGHSLGFRIVAEGVETQAQASFLGNAGCDQLQGYYFSKPVDAERAARLLGRGTLHQAA